MFDYTPAHEAFPGSGPTHPRQPRVSRPGPDPTAARRRRAVAERRATLSAAEPGWSTLVVLLPSADAATILLRCDGAAELVD